MPKITIKLNTRSIDAAIKEVRAYSESLKSKTIEFSKRLGEVGFTVADSVMSGHVFSGETRESLQLVDYADGRMALTAGSEALLFFEFGAGARYGGGHPWDDDFGFGPGTYPGNGHWDDPFGWWFPTDDPRLKIRTDKNGQGWGHSYGNKPYMPFYKASVEMRSKVVQIAREVFK